MKSNIQTEIDQYLSAGGPFGAGLALARRAGVDARWLEWLEREAWTGAVSTAARERLEELLRGCLHVEFRPLTPPDGEEGRRGTFPPDQVSALRQKGRELLKRQAFLHAQLVTYSEEPDTPARRRKLHQVAREIMDGVIPQIDAVYSQIRQFEETGEIKGSTQPAEFDRGAAAVKKRNSIRVSITRYRRLIEAEADPLKRHGYEKALARKEGELNELEAILGE